MRIHRSFPVVAVLALVLACSRTPQTLKIGVINSETGTFAAFGRSVSDGLKMGVDEVNNKGGIGGRQIELVTEDDASDTQRSVEAFRKLANEKVAAVIGPISSDGTTATAPVAAQSGILQISPIAPRKGDAAGTGNTFLIYPSTADATRQAVTLAVQRFNAKRIALLHSEDRAIESAQATARQMMVDIVATERFSRGAKEFTSQIQKIVAAKPDVIIYPSFFEEESIAITNSLRASMTTLGDARIIMDGAACLELLQSDVLGDPLLQQRLFILNEAFGPDLPGQQRMQQFITDYRRRFNQTPTTYAGAAHATVTILADLLGKGTNAEGAQLTAALRSGQYDTAFGAVRFSEAGLNQAARFELFKVTPAKELQLAPQ